jgi:hypothetical protein
MAAVCTIRNRILEPEVDIHASNSVFPKWYSVSENMSSAKNYIKI